jgi:hypothetical protein
LDDVLDDHLLDSVAVGGLMSAILLDLSASGRRGFEVDAAPDLLETELRQGGGPTGTDQREQEYEKAQQRIAPGIAPISRIAQRHDQVQESEQQGSYRPTAAADDGSDSRRDEHNESDGDVIDHYQRRLSGYAFQSQIDQYFSGRSRLAHHLDPTRDLGKHDGALAQHAELTGQRLGAVGFRGPCQLGNQDIRLALFYDYR